MIEKREPAMAETARPNDLDSYWMPFTANRQFKAKPRLMASAEGMYYRSTDGRKILDGTAGLWCVNAGHGRREIAEAVQRQLVALDYAPAFQMGHPAIFEAASRIAALLPGGLDHVFFGNSGSEAVETALKIALAYHRARGDGARTRLIGRERGYHGVGFGGISVGGIAGNRKLYAGIPSVDHLPHTFNLGKQAFSRGQPEWGAELADDLERIAALHDPSTIAAVIVEPMAGSTGVLVPPKGYLERLKAICDKYGFLLIFDEVITGFGRLGAAFATELFGIVPDMVCFAKGVTNGCVPMGGVVVKKHIYDAFMQGPENLIEFAHGYTYSGHPIAAAAALATLDIYATRGSLQPRQIARALLGGRGPCAERPVQHRRSAQYRPRLPGSSWRRLPASPARVLSTSMSNASSAACWCARPATSWRCRRRSSSRSRRSTICSACCARC